MTPTVLIVDDSTFIVEGLVALLRKSYRALPSFGGAECLDILRTEQPDVIVLDIMMEPMDGWETLSRIKNNPATRHIPVLMFSAKKISPDEAEAHRIRIDDFVTKPVNPRELLAALEKILEREKQKKKILYHWSKLGTPREKTDEFLTLSSNLDVDMSLVAAHKKQMDHPSTLPARREELASSIAVLEARIEQGRTRIGEFFKETGLTLPSPSDDEPDAQTPADDTAGSMPVPADADGTAAPLLTATEEPPTDETAGQEPGEMADSAAGEHPDAPGSVITGPNPDQVPQPAGGMTVQEDESSGRDEPVEPSVSPEPGHEPPAVLQSDDTPPPVPQPPEPQPPEPPGTTTPITGQTENLPPVPGSGQAGGSSGPGLLPAPEPGLEAPREKEARAQGPVTLVRTVPEGEVRPSATPQRGFLSGIIAAIVGLFSRRKK